MFTDFAVRDPDLARDREQALRDRLRRPDGTPFNLWPADTDIPDPAVFYPACFAVPYGDRTLMHFRGGGGDEAEAEAEEADDATTSSQNDVRLPPMLFSYLRANQSEAPARYILHGGVDRRDAAEEDLATTPPTMGPNWRKSDTVLTGIFVKSSQTFVADDVLVARGEVCCHQRPALPIAWRAREFHAAVRDAQNNVSRRWFSVVVQSHRLAPLDAVQCAAAGGTVKQWLPDLWVPEKYAVKVYQLRDLHSARPFLNLCTNNWSKTWNPPVMVAGSGVTVLEEEEIDDDEDEEADDDDANRDGVNTTRKKKRRKRVVWTPMELDPLCRFRNNNSDHRGGGAAGGVKPRLAEHLGPLLVRWCPVYRSAAIFAVQADTGKADIYRLFCRSTHDASGGQSLQADIVAHNNHRNNSAADAADNEDEDALFRTRLAFYQFALVPSFVLSASMNAWFRNVPEQERLAWTVAGVPQGIDVIPPELRNEDGRRVLLMVCLFDVDRCRWIPQNLVPFAYADRLVREESLLASEDDDAMNE